MNENNDIVKLTAKQLDGLPESVLKQLKTESTVSTFTSSILSCYPPNISALSPLRSPLFLISFFLFYLQDGETYYIVTMKYPDILPALKYVKDINARKELERVYTSR